MMYDLDGKYAPSQYLLGNVEKVYSCSCYFEVLVNRGFVKKRQRTSEQISLYLQSFAKKKKKKK